MKLLYWVKRLKHEKKNSPTTVYTALLSMVLCMICLAGTTWAWFTANQTVGVDAITSAEYGILVSIEGEEYTEGQHEGNMRFYTLSPNQSYTITLTPAEENTATTGYCLVAVDDIVYYTSPITAETSFAFTYQTGMEVPDGMTTVEYDKLISETWNPNLTIAWYWGTYPNTQDFAAFGADPGYILLENGAVLGAAPGEVLLKAELTLNLTDISIPENDGFIPLNEDYSLVLTPDEGYKLPGYILVEMDGTVYEVYTDGADHRDIFLDELSESDNTLLPPIPSFDPVTGTLTIPAVLLTEEIQSVIISAAAVKMEEAECICEIKCIVLNETCPVCRDSVEGCTGYEELDEVIEIVEITEETDSTGEADNTGEADSEQTPESDEVIDLTKETDSAEDTSSAEENGSADAAESDEIIDFTEIADSAKSPAPTETTGTDNSEINILEFSISLDSVSEDLSESMGAVEEIIMIEP